MAQDEYGTADMTWHKIWALLDDHYLRLDIVDDLMLDSDRIIMHMTKIIRIVWNFTRDSMATGSMLGNVLITPEYNWWTREFYNWRILILGKLVNLAGNYFDSWIDKVSTQWLSWTHVPIVSRGHDYNYEMRLTTITRWDWLQLQDEITRLFKIKGDISKCEILG